ncbi:receptor-like protein EIX1 isoform X2 [Cryptomeria japonica]|uniref:receptor-like protein EIX1 isoform X2 n=1 Tax=Cryptomeria japonica TaxID=3369 RepID=UPI0027DA00CD|nr:receptor-like protein EIX1 isoform X2 [Cryptomeria japonica]
MLHCKLIHPNSHCAMANLILFSVITLFLLSFCCGCIEKEAHALLLFKAGLSHSADLLSSWEKGTNCCLWDGISCDETSHHIVGVDIAGFSLSAEMEGVISESLCTLTSAATISLTGMGLTGG